MNVLEKICAEKSKHIAWRKKMRPEAELLSEAKRLPSCRPFLESLKRRAEAGKPALIAEIKKASPSRGVIRADFDPPALAVAYEQGGASCLSVLTDTPYFQGEDAYLAAARNAVNLPVLRKDFMLDPYQIIESRTIGADCILLIMAALSDIQAAELEAAAFELGMAVLIEVHDEAELARALSLRSALIGVNNRNLKTLEVDLRTSEALKPLIPAGRLAVCESGVSEHADILRMQGAGIHCFLVGESLMSRPDVERATRQLLGGK